ncbi:MAG: sugar isomerase [Acidobacteria bacterium]|nr:MAG: sugar isomerase [Acidobacteriota bacterium]
MNHLDEIFRDHPQPAAFARAYLDYVIRVIGAIDVNEIAAFARVLLDARERDARIYFIGNGGSAATASHFANDVAIGCRSWQKPFRAMSLTDNVSILTAVGNDYGYEEIFVVQLKTLMQRGDVVVAISASGNSPNVLKAVEYANANGAITVALTGFDGGKLRRLAQSAVHVPTSKGEYGPVEDIHMVFDHLIGAFLMHVCAAEPARTLSAI